MEKIRTLFTRFVGFFTTTIWNARRSERSTVQWLLIRLLRTAILSVQGFTRHHGPLRASALTFFSLLSLVPVAAMAFGIAKGFGFERRLQQELLDKFSAQQEVVEQVIGFAQNMLNNTKGGMIAGIGVVVLFWAVIKVLSNIETFFQPHLGGSIAKLHPKTERLPDHHAGLPGTGDHVRQRHGLHHFPGIGHFRPI